MAILKKKNNLVLFTSYILLFSTLIFVSVISVIYKNIYKVNAQLDIQYVIPEPTQTAPQAPVYQRPPQNTQPNTPQQFTSGAPTCVSNNALTNVRRIKVVVAGQGGNGDFYISNENGNLTAKDVFNEVDRILNNLNESGSENKAPLKEVYSMTTSQERGTCTVRISSPASPTIFIYSQNTKVYPLVPINYQEQTRDYFYYEYNRSEVKFNKPKEGWIVDKNDLSDFTSKIANELKLTKLEKERLYFELNFSASDVKSDKLFIGLIPQKEVDEKLPLKIFSPNNPKVIRYHFYISKAQTKEVKQPKLEKVQRDKPFILELGSFAEKQ